ncbi:MAG: SH3 domain-containing protein [Thainema sp.]
MLFGLAIPHALAQPSQSNQAIHQPASLVAPDPEMEINIYPKPDTRTARVGFGLSGDPVTVLEQVGSNSGTTWNRIQFEGATEAAGWVQLDYLSLQSSDQQGQSNPASGGYLGNRSSQQAQQSRQQSSFQRYRQQDQQRNY